MHYTSAVMSTVEDTHHPSARGLGEPPYLKSYKLRFIYSDIHKIIIIKPLKTQVLASPSSISVMDLR